MEWDRMGMNGMEHYGNEGDGNEWDGLGWMGLINKMGYGTIHFLFCFRNEVLRERHSTAKKLRRYYLQCLKQMLEEDRLALETSAALASAEEKMDKMKRALEAGSPGTDRTGERQEDVIGQIGL